MEEILRFDDNHTPMKMLTMENSPTKSWLIMNRGMKFSGFPQA